jgi:hypothetical protein
MKKYVLVKYEAFRLFKKNPTASTVPISYEHIIFNDSMKLNKISKYIFTSYQKSTSKLEDKIPSKLLICKGNRIPQKISLQILLKLFHHLLLLEQKNDEKFHKINSLLFL